MIEQRCRRVSSESKLLISIMIDWYFLISVVAEAQKLSNLRRTYRKVRINMT